MSRYPPERPPGYPSMPDYPPTQDYPPTPDYAAAPGFPPMPDYGVTPGYPQMPDYPGGAHGEYGTAQDDYGPPPGGHAPAHGGYPLAPGEYRLAHETATAALRAIRPPPEPVVADARPGSASPAPALRARPRSASPAPALRARPRSGPVPRYGGTGARVAMLGYLTVPLLGFAVPLAVYLLNLRGSTWTRAHAAQALNVWITVMLYDVSALIMGTMLALDSPTIALIVFGPPVIGVWLAALRLLVQAATAASEGRKYTFPRWLCSRIVR